MSLLDKLRDYVRPYNEDDEDSGEDTEVFPTRRQSNSGDSMTVDLPGEIRRNKVVNIHATTQLSVVLSKPERFDNAAEVADHLREKRTVVLNLEGVDKAVSRRLLDFLSGVAYANDGNLKKVSNDAYIITPFNVEIRGDIIDELENNGLCF